MADNRQAFNGGEMRNAWTNNCTAVAVASILFNPTFWNIVARLEYKTHILTKIAGGNPYYGCYGLAVTIFSLGIVRDHLYNLALADQPTHPAMQGFGAQAAAVGLFLSGGVLVLSSMWSLGVTGTYLGDYFGILMDEMVTGFPFNVTQSPMYWGSTMSFLGTALWYGKPAGFFLSALVYLTYKVALALEDPFTAEIYAKRERERATVAKGEPVKPKGGVTKPKGGVTKAKGL